MKLQIIIFILIIFAFNKVSFSQDNQDNLSLLITSTEPNCEEILASLDNLAIELKQNPNSIGYIVIYGDSNQIRNKFVERYVYIRTQAFGKSYKNRFIITSSETKEKLKIDFWLSKDGKAKPIIKEVSFSFILPTNEKSIVFVRDSVEIVKIDGKLTYFGYCSACCIEKVDLNFLSEFLKANLLLKAHIKIYGKSRKYTKKLEKLINEEAINEYSIQGNRFQISYEGIDKGIVQMPKNMATVEIEFVPQK